MKFLNHIIIFTINFYKKPNQNYCTIKLLKKIHQVGVPLFFFFFLLLLRYLKFLTGISFNITIKSIEIVKQLQNK